jgi:flagellar biosynthesis/type III secretory pathway chaperone
MTDECSNTLRGEEIGHIVEDLIQTVEQEVEAFKHLHQTLLDQQKSILKADSDSVSESSETIEKIVLETRKLETDWKGRSKALSQAADSEEDLRLHTLIPMVERRYAIRLEELYQMLQMMMAKVHSTNRHNRLLLERSLHFVKRNMQILTGASNGLASYGPDGKSSNRDDACFQGLG